MEDWKVAFEKDFEATQKQIRKFQENIRAIPPGAGGATIRKYETYILVLETGIAEAKEQFHQATKVRMGS